MNSLSGIKVAVLLSNGFEQAEMVEPKKALENAGAVVKLVSPESNKVQGWKHHEKADFFSVDIPLEQANAADFQALLLPGGVVNPDALRLVPKAIEFVREFIQADKPIAAICHGPWTLINAGGVKNRTMTSWPSLELDLKNAGANWVDREVVRDGKLVTSRKPADLPAFNKEIIELFSEVARS